MSNILMHINMKANTKCTDSNAYSNNYATEFIIFAILS